MKLFAVFLALALYSLTLVQCLNLPRIYPEPNVKCLLECDTKEFKSICAADDKGTTKTYRNLCIMKTENCLQDANFQKISDNECP